MAALTGADRHARGRLSVIATPIGNLGDLTARAAQTLAAADLVLCEDTRHSARLLAHLGLHKPVQSLHAHNERDKTADLAEKLRQGQHLAIVSDAGTPGLCDPGQPLIAAAHELGAVVESLPGPFAVAVALAGCGWQAVPFTFWGFAAKTAKERRADWAAQLQPAPAGPMVHAYFVPGRDVRDVLADVHAVAPDVQACVARELTKLHEGYFFGSPAQLAQDLPADADRGEAVLLLRVAERPQPVAAAPADAAALVAAAKAAGENRKHALHRIGAQTGLSRNALYDLWAAAAAED